MTTPAYETLEAAQQHASLLQSDQTALLEAAQVAQNQVAQNALPPGCVPGDCGVVCLKLWNLARGNGLIEIDITSFQGNITSVLFQGEWVKWPPGAGGFNNANSKIHLFNSPKALVINRFTSGPGNVFANLTFLEVTTQGGPCFGLLPSNSTVIS